MRLPPLALLAACHAPDAVPALQEKPPSTDTGNELDSGTTGGDTGTDTGPLDTSGPPTTLSLSLSLGPVRPLLARDEPLAIVVEVKGADALMAEGWEAVDLVLLGIDRDGVSHELARLTDAALADGPSYDLSWTPTDLGRRELVVTAELEGWDLGSSGSWRVAVTPQLLQVHHWAAQPDTHHWVTALLAPSSIGGSAEEDLAWQDRGALPLAWKGDDAASTDGAEAYADSLTSLDESVRGFLIDEMFNGTAGDQVVGEALGLARSAHPELFIAAYSQGASGTAMIDGLAASDLVMVEAYPPDFRSYEGYGERLAQVQAAGLGDRAVPALSLYQATNVAELRQQVSWFRNQFPDSPGIAIFGGAPSAALDAALDEVVEEAFLAPALTLVVAGTTATVRNIGGEDAEDVKISFLDADGAVVDLVDLGTLLAGGIDAAASLSNFEEVSLSAADGVSLLTWTDPRERVPDAAAAQTWWEGLVADATEEAVLDGRPTLTEVRSAGSLTQATLPLNGTSSFAVEATFTLVDARIYGEAGLGLSSEQGSLILSLYHGESDGDLASDATRATLTWTAADGTQVWALIPVGLSPGSYTFRLAIDGGTVRALILDASGGLVGDTGALDFDGSFTPDTVVFDVRDSSASSVSWDGAGAERLRLYGAANGSYFVDAWVSALRVFSMAR